MATNTVVSTCKKRGSKPLFRFDEETKELSELAKAINLSPEKISDELPIKLHFNTVRNKLNLRSGWKDRKEFELFKKIITDHYKKLLKIAK